jgi:riboflavin transporter FmnP
VKGGARSLVVSLPVRIAFSCFLNGCITLPLYAKAMGMSLDQVVAVVGAVNPYITNLPTFLVLATIPFNLLKLSLNYLAGYLLYTRLKSANVLSHMASE